MIAAADCSKSFTIAAVSGSAAGVAPESTDAETADFCRADEMCAPDPVGPPLMEKPMSHPMMPSSAAQSQGSLVCMLAGGLSD